MESTNEELTTVNEELNNRNLELARLNGDMVNFQASTRLSIVLLGREFRFAGSVRLRRRK